MKKYSYLNLNQKMIKIRKKLPALIRKRYSEEVDYDFVKLDDINQFLTPALNKYGVDFDIIREIATQTDESGRPVFLVRDGNIWRYEADLEICWINADHPEEKLTSVIHLVGSNDVADKAKGTAITYGLKYYLLNKFNISQNGEEDPDMHGKKEASTKKEEASKKPERAKQTENPKVEKRSQKENQVKPAKTESVAVRAFVPEDDLDDRPEEIETVKNPQVRNGNAVSLAGKAQEEKAVNQKKEEAEPDTALPEEEPFDADIEAEEEFTVEEETNSDGFRMVTAKDEVPFSEAETFEAEVPSVDQEVEKAKSKICDFGPYMGHPLGDMAKTPKGWATLKWIANSYRGGNKEMKEAARVLVEAEVYAAA
ncbi:ERF family protein [Parablautia sp. Marseille-Q6255]|uniref:ERF family protein n=1 Tax=Parablautia sp. Marseille-Q6255 TaxID=3039593 RepID=UPI0024BBF4B8|nr:ERF family protein [Parablautia sp. Marseille-Q6255]